MAGLWFEQFVVGQVFAHEVRKTVLDYENSLFSSLTYNPAQVHIDHAYCATTEFGKPLVNSCFTIALVTGQSVTDVSQNVFANLGWDEVRLPNPVFEGDTLYAESEVLELRASKSRPDVGIVTIKTIGYNQSGVIVIAFRRTLMVYRRGKGPGDKYRPEPQKGA